MCLQGPIIQQGPQRRAHSEHRKLEAAHHLVSSRPVRCSSLSFQPLPSLSCEMLIWIACFAGFWPVAVSMAPSRMNQEVCQSCPTCKEDDTALSSFSSEVYFFQVNLTSLYFRALNSNQFSGKIPASLGNLSSLYWFDIADNQLSGPLPISTSGGMGLDKLLKTKHLQVQIILLTAVSSISHQHEKKMECIAN